MGDGEQGAQVSERPKRPKKILWKACRKESGMNRLSFLGQASSGSQIGMPGHLGLKAGRWRLCNPRKRRNRMCLLDRGLFFPLRPSCGLCTAKALLCSAGWSPLVCPSGIFPGWPCLVTRSCLGPGNTQERNRNCPRSQNQNNRALESEPALQSRTVQLRGPHGPIKAPLTSTPQIKPGQEAH